MDTNPKLWGRHSRYCCILTEYNKCVKENIRLA